ncbi:hypothetical protein JHK84_043441 [Glycine max]|nr:hypothetical protein JHK86_043258 [Glycine max]KAG5117328.1 hypothetical protein JHK84_043441 [Glycine max]
MMKQILEAIQPSTTSSTNEPLEDQGHADAFTSLVATISSIYTLIYCCCYAHPTQLSKNKPLRSQDVPIVKAMEHAAKSTASVAHNSKSHDSSTLKQKTNGKNKEPIIYDVGFGMNPLFL